jgi:hypothetical protein
MGEGVPADESGFEFLPIQVQEQQVEEVFFFGPPPVFEGGVFLAVNE